MKKLKLSVMLLTMCLSVSANANLIDIQQRELKAAEPSWVQPAIPSANVVSSRTPRSSGEVGVSIYARNVDFIFTCGIGFHIENLTATFEPLNPKDPVNMDDPRQFIIRVHSGTVVVQPFSLSSLFNFHILDYWPRPLNHVRISTNYQTLTTRAGLRLWSKFPPIGWVPASLTGGITLDQYNRLVYTPYEVSALGIPIAGLLRSMGINLDDLITLNRQGAQLYRNSLVLDPRTVFPPPALKGTVTGVSLDPYGLHLQFGNGRVPEFNLPKSAGNSFIWIQSGDIKLFNILVVNANILIKDHSSMPLRFNLYDYREIVGAQNNMTMAEDGSIVMTMFTH